MARPRRISAPQELKRKAVNPNKGVDIRLSDEQIAELDAVIQKSADTFIQQAGEQLRGLRTAFREAEIDMTARKSFARTAYDTSFEIKGLGGMFDLPLMTAIAKSLNDFLDGLETPDDRQMAIIGHHLDALYAVLANLIKGQGGEVERDLLDAFQQATERFK
jgi:hypothetical protein